MKYLYYLFQNPFDADVAICPDILQLELIELQANDLLKDKFFYQFLPKEQFPNLRNFASGFLCMFGTTYMCEQTFSKMKLIRSNLRTNLSDNHLKYLLILGTYGLKLEFSCNPNIKKAISSFSLKKYVLLTVDLYLLQYHLKIFYKTK